MVFTFPIGRADVMYVSRSHVGWLVRLGSTMHVYFDFLMGIGVGNT